MRNLIFVGLPGSGKSTVGRLAARTLGLPFVDADKALEQAEGRSIPDIFAAGGESYFRTLETRVLTDLCRREGMVLATGGGAVLRRENRTLLKGSGLVIFLDRSPCAIRRTLRLLADMKVVEVKEQSGVYVLSADNARRYLHNFADQTDIRGKQQQLKELLVRQEHLNRQMAALCRDILDETSQTPDALPNYYCRIPDDWPHSGTTVGALRFWQATGATIVAIRRGLSYIVSPGPYAELYAGDAVIFVGGVKAREAVSHFFANP